MSPRTITRNTKASETVQTNDEADNNNMDVDNNDTLILAQRPKSTRKTEKLNAAATAQKKDDKKRKQEATTRGSKSKRPRLVASQSDEHIQFDAAMVDENGAPFLIPQPISVDPTQPPISSKRKQPNKPKRTISSSKRSQSSQHSDIPNNNNVFVVLTEHSNSTTGNTVFCLNQAGNADGALAGICVVERLTPNVDEDFIPSADSDTAIVDHQRQQPNNLEAESVGNICFQNEN
jgi:hypothetical protein